MRRVVSSNKYLMSAHNYPTGVITSVAEQPTTIGLSREQAERIISRGQFTTNGIVVHIFDNRLSHLPQITTEELRGMDLVIFANKGTIEAGKYGPSFVLEVGENPSKATHSWLVNCASVVGRQLVDHKDFPLMVNLRHVTPDEGNEYDTLGVPLMFANAIRDESSIDELPF